MSDGMPGPTATEVSLNEGAVHGRDLRPETQPETPWPKKIYIVPVENGFIVEIGCKRFVADTWDRASVGLGLYFQDPQAAEEKYCKK